MLLSLLPLALAALVVERVHSIELNVDDAGSIKSAAETVAGDMMGYYTGYRPGDNPGNLPEPYYWWEAGSMFSHMVHYWYYTGDSQFNDKVTQAITWQAGQNGAFMPQNQTKDEGNDDQAFWAFAAMDAAELGYPAPGDDYPSWAAMAQATFNTQAPRWDDSSCGGGLKWQIIPLNQGYDYKNVASNGGFFKLAAQLARYTGNETFTHWVEKEWEWFTGSVLYDDKNPDSIRIYDGTDDQENCVTPNKALWTYNYGIILAGLAYIYNHTEDAKWLPPLQGILGGIDEMFYRQDVIMETACEPYAGGCGTDSLTFKSFLLRWLAVTAQLVPSVSSKIWPLVRSSAQGAAGQCVGDGGSTCGYHWNESTWDGTQGVGQQMSALAAVQAMMIPAGELQAPLTLETGGTSKADPDAGTDAEDPADQKGSEAATRKITGADRAGANFVTFLMVVGMAVGAAALCWEGEWPGLAKLKEVVPAVKKG